MKKILFLMPMLAALFFVGCSSNDEGNESDQLEYIQVQVTSEDTPTPNGNVYLFKVNGYEINSDEPNDWTIDYTPFISYEYNGEHKYMYPVSKHGSKYKGELLANKEKGYSSHSIYWYELSTLYGTPKAGDEYLVFVRLNNGTYAKSSKRFVITKNSIIKVKLPSCTDKSEFVNAKWEILDYK